jgi:hypothetical protein
MITNYCGQICLIFNNIAFLRVYIYYSEFDIGIVVVSFLMSVVIRCWNRISSFAIHFNREQILSMKNENKQNIIDTLSSMPCALEADDVADFCSLAQYYALKTPRSFRKVRCTSLEDTCTVSSHLLIELIKLEASFTYTSLVVTYEHFSPVIHV